MRGSASSNVCPYETHQRARILLSGAQLTTRAALELNGDSISRDNFVLPTLGPKLVSLAEELYDGKGLCVIRGINRLAYPVEDLTTVWLGIQAYVAERRGCQDHRGNMLGKSSLNAWGRVPRTCRRQISTDRAPKCT